METGIVTAPPGSPWKNEVVFHDGDAFFQELCREIGEARESIDLETYIFNLDRLGKLVMQLLIRAADRGVRVRLLLDGVGSTNLAYADIEPLIRAGGQARFYHPLPWQRANFAFLKYLTPRKITAGAWKLNRRNHRKTCVIDGRIGFAGGMNVSALHLQSVVGDDAWRDSSVRIEGPPIARITAAFEYAWTHPTEFKVRWERSRTLPVPPEDVRLNMTRKQRRASYADLLLRILGARERIWITNPYFVPARSLVRALRHAARKGVDVRILVSRHNDIFGLQWVIRAFYLTLLRSGVRIFEYLPSVLHAKIMIIDDWLTIGSSNLNHRSLLHDLEVDVVLTHPESHASVEKQYAIDLAQSEEVSLREFQRQRLPGTEIAEQCLLTFRRWL